MSSSLSLLVLLLILSSLACTEEKLKTQKQAFLDNEISKEVEGGGEDQVSPLSSYSVGHIEVDRLLSSAESKDLLLALAKIEDYILSSKLTDPRFYSSQSYVGYLTRYVKLFKLWEKEKGDSQFNESFKSSLHRFYEMYFAGCIDSQQRNCEKIKFLKRNPSIVTIVNYFLVQESDLHTKLKLCGIGFDLLGSQKDKLLEKIYLETFVAYLVDLPVKSRSLPHDELRRHSVNVLTTIKMIDWGSANNDFIKVFKKIKPWLLAGAPKTYIEQLRAALLPVLPVVLKREVSFAEDLIVVSKNLIANIHPEPKNLKNYPAFSDIDLKPIFNENPLLVYLLVSTYTQSFDTVTANQFFSKIENKARSAGKLFSLVKVLVRWDLAQLSLSTTEKLAKEYLKYQVKTKENVQSVIDYSETLNLPWSEFHNQRTLSVKKMILAQKDFLKGDGSEVNQFFNSIDRNILKTTVYPNMLAFIYFMAKTEWKAKITFWYRSYVLDSSSIYEELINGGLRYPWFNFVRLDRFTGSTSKTQYSLFRSEILDSFYYLISAGVAKAYQIDVDDMLLQMGKSLMKKRLPEYEIVLDNQKQIYWDENSKQSVFRNWCDGQKKGRLVAENIPFYFLDQSLLGPTLLLKEEKGIFKIENSTSLYSPLYFDDYFSDNISFQYTRVVEVTDKVKQELTPLIHFYDQTVKIVERFSQAESMEDISIERAKEYLQQLRRIKSVYLGSQISIARAVEDCLDVAIEESRRRSFLVAKYESLYLEKVVYPLMRKVFRGELSPDSATKELKVFAESQEGFVDRITSTNSNYVNYLASKMSFLLRVRAYLQKGIQFNGVNLPPIVGAHIEIPIPSNLLNDDENPFKTTHYQNDQHYKSIKTGAETTAREFVSQSISKFTDSLAASASTQWNRFSEWDNQETQMYLKPDVQRIEFYVQMLQLSGSRYTDFSQPLCRDFSQKLSEDCYLTAEFTLDDLVRVVGKVFAHLELDSDSTDYLNLLGLSNFISKYNISLQMKLDGNADYIGAKGIFPTTEANAFLDVPMGMLQADYLGILNYSDFDVFVFEKADDFGFGKESCEELRDDCYFGNEKSRASTFFTARSQRSGLLFKFDPVILEEEYDFVRTQVTKKFNWVIDLENQSDELMNEHRHNQLSYKYDVRVSPSDLEALTFNKKFNQTLADDFFKEETGGFFLPLKRDWSEYLYQGDR